MEINMSNVVNGNTIKVHYTGKLEDGTVFDSSENREPLEFIVGSGQVIAGFDGAVIDMSIGDKKTVEIAPEQAYGQYMNELVIQVPIDKFSPDAKPNIGDRYNLQQPEGNTVQVSVVDVKDELVSLDANHPLAGKVLVFDLELVEIV
jgi:peptidylprolyl isomerase